MRFFKPLRGIFRRGSNKKIKGLQEKYSQYKIGRGSYGDPRVISWDEGATLEIGAFCSFADGVQIFLGGEHRTDWVTTYPFSALWGKAKHIKGFPKTKGDVSIGNDVWIAMDAVIMSGVTIGNGAVVGARAVVTKDIEPYAIYAGNPARFIRKRFDDAVIQDLLDLKWWIFSDQEIEQILPLLLDADISAFISEAKKLKKSN